MKLEIKDLEKIYDGQIVLKNINFKIDNGIYGLLGANGAGKSTLIKCICQLIYPEKGSIEANGKLVASLGDSFFEQLGYLPQDVGYYPEYRTTEFLLFMGSLKGMAADKCLEKIKHYLSLFGLEKEANKKLKDFSGGMLRRIGIIQAMLDEPSLLILDEPSAGLDPKERIRLRNILSKYAEKHTVIISTHIVSDIEHIAKEILILKNGQIVSEGTREELLAELFGKVWSGSVEFHETEQLEMSYQISNIRNEGETNIIRIISDVKPIDSFIQVKPNLDDLYLSYFKREDGE